MKLETAARCALADLIDLTLRYDLYQEPSAQTILDLYQTLKANGEIVDDYAEEVDEIKELREDYFGENTAFTEEELFRRKYCIYHRT